MEPDYVSAGESQEAVLRIRENPLACFYGKQTPVERENLLTAEIKRKTSPLLLEEEMQKWRVPGNPEESMKRAARIIIGLKVILEQQTLMMYRASKKGSKKRQKRRKRQKTKTTESKTPCRV